MSRIVLLIALSLQALPPTTSATQATGGDRLSVTVAQDAYGQQWVVRYRYNGGRWHGYGPYDNYWHAYQVCLDLRKGGADAYVEAY